MTGYFMQTWRLIETGGRNGCYNMAVDEAIAMAVRERRAETTLRFYTWDPPCISIGYFQKPDESLNGSIVRRITGGRAVFHGSDLSYSVVSTTDNVLFPNSISGTYAAIANALTAGLKRFGINPDTAVAGDAGKVNSSGYRKTVLCFNSIIRDEITVGGKKLAGSAQRRWTDVFLQHGSILVSVTNSGNGRNTVSVRDLVALPDEVSVLIASLSKGFEETFGVRLIKEDLSEYESELAERLTEEKYSIL